MTREKAKKHIEINLIALYDIGENIIECDDVMVIIDEIYNDHEQDAKRFKNFILLLITVAAIMAAMIYINI